METLPPTAFEFATATRIVFGRGKLAELGPIAKGLGSRVLLVAGRNPERARRLQEIFTWVNLETTLFSIAGEPTLDAVRAGVRAAREADCQFIVGYGGGSPMDAAKAIAAMLTNSGDLLDYLEVIGKAQPLQQAPAPYVLNPTTAGTGTEVTRNAVLASPEHRFKVSLRSPMLFPRVALIDPGLTDNLPPEITATTGLDALTQLIEPFVSHRANPMTDAFCREGLRRAGQSLRRAYFAPTDTRARDDMALASLFGGLSLANAALGAVHGFAAPLGGMFRAAHGAVCAALLVPATEVNVRALTERQPTGQALRRYKEWAALVTDNAASEISDGIDWLRALVRDLKIPPLHSYGVSAAEIPEVVEKASRASSMKGNPVALTSEELREILERAV